MNDIFIGLAVWRVSLMLVQERGLFGVFERLRTLFNAGVVLPEYYTGEMPKQNEIGMILNCVWCMSIWIGALACYLAHRPIWFVLVYSALAVLCQSWADRN